jgi:hypothetical protein
MERVYYILLQQQIINLDFSRFIKNSKEGGFLKYLKKLGVYQTSGARERKSTWCDPYIWALVAMELNPLLYAKSSLELFDNLIKLGIDVKN